MRSRIFQGETMHCRHRPRRHAFRYRMFWLSIDLDELPALDRGVRGFSVDRWNLASIRGRDHGGPGAGTVRQRIIARIREAGIDESVSTIDLVTIPRVVGMVFNPVCFYLCRCPDGLLSLLVAEVRNTFGEMHHYVAQPVSADHGGTVPLLFHVPKRFHVSPFLDTHGVYDIRISESEDRFDIAIDLRKPEGIVLSATMVGDGARLTSGRLIGTIARLPVFTATIMWRIHWQAFLLAVKHRLPMHVRPEPFDAATIPAPRRSVWHRMREAFVARAGRPVSIGAPSQDEPIQEHES